MCVVFFCFFYMLVVLLAAKISLLQLITFCYISVRTTVLCQVLPLTCGSICTMLPLDSFEGSGCGRLNMFLIFLNFGIHGWKRSPGDKKINKIIIRS